jgi:hypothetical protein
MKCETCHLSAQNGKLICNDCFAALFQDNSWRLYDTRKAKLVAGEYTYQDAREMAMLLNDQQGIKNCFILKRV